MYQVLTYKSHCDQFYYKVSQSEMLLFLEKFTT